MRTIALAAALAACGGSSSQQMTGDGPGSGSAADAATDGKPCVESCAPGTWCIEPAPVASTVVLAAVAVQGGNVYAFGDAGTILHRGCNTWSAMTSGTTSDLRGAWATAASVWAVGKTGTILRYDGAAWHAITGVTTSDLTAVWGASDSDLWVASASGAAYHWDGAQWASSSLGGVLLSVSGSAGDNVWAAAESGYVRHYTTSWSATIDPAGTVTYFAALARSPTDVWVTSAQPGKETMNYNGLTWTAHGTSSTVIQALWARADNDLWGTASRKVGHWDGAMWTFEQPTGVTMPLQAVAGTATDLFVVGAGATILHRD